MNDWLNVLFSLLAGPLTDQQRDALANLEANWVLLNTRNGRWFVDICAPKRKLLNIRDYLIAAGRDPKIIAIFEHSEGQVTEDIEVPTFDEEGNRLGQVIQQVTSIKQIEVLRNGTTFDMVEYLKVAPDVKTYDPITGALLLSTRPTGYVETHRFAGWGPKVLS